MPRESRVQDEMRSGAQTDGGPAMAYTTTFIDGGRGVLHVARGIVVSEEILGGAREIQRDEARARQLKYGITDLTDVEELRVTTQDMRRIAEGSKRTALLVPHGFVAIVAPRDHLFGMARMWEALVDEAEWETSVFRTRNEADAWIQTRLAGTTTSPSAGV